eukprot:TRINITY_DN8251_c0_g1_i2.p1 TRINITY_DN8251_c0_g1~~TRINITY_DN8251_c0_g1_i2.p1  ORF type:complete len:629 (+),score=164.15 TRINITY_DN8251_c0_g1_i2:100-1986(+)
MAEEGPLRLAEVLRFDAVDGTDPDLNVIYDEVNKDVFIAREGGSSVKALSVLDGTVQTIGSLPREPVLSMRYSTDTSILAIRRNKRTIALVNREVGAPTYTLNVKNKLAELRTFFWVSKDEILLVTSLSLELYRVNPRKRNTKQLKSYNVSVSWYRYSSSTNVLITASSIQPNVINPFLITRSTIHKIPRLEVSLPHAATAPQLKEANVALIRVYSRLYMAVTKDNPKSYAGPAAEIYLYLVTREGILEAHSLELDVNGPFLLNTLDNLVLVHHQLTKKTYAFDVEAQLSRRATMTTSGGEFFRHDPVFKAPLMHTPPSEGTAAAPANYPAWLAFPSNVLIDPQAGCLYQIKLKASLLIHHTTDTAHLIDVLVRRKDGQEAILAALRQECEKRTAESLACMAVVFDSMHRVEKIIQSKAPDTLKRFNYQRIDQKLMYHEIFQPLSDDIGSEEGCNFLMKLTTEYIRSLTFNELPVQHFIYELVINTLVSQGKEYQLHQFLQYHVVDDSKPVACLLLSLQSKYPPAFQLALDMFKRLGDADNDIFDVLLSTEQVLSALRYMRSMGTEAVASIPARRFLEAARNTNDEMLFYNVYTFFVNRNTTLRGSPEFLPEEQCAEFVKHFDVTFSS